MLASQVKNNDIEEWKADSERHTTILHQGNKGFITLASIKEGKYKQWHYKYKDLINSIIENDCYISQNTFYSTYRRIEYLKEINALYVDIDYYNTCYSKEAVLFYLENILYKDNEIPVPTLVIDSGRGLYLIWMIKNVPAQALPLFNALQQNFYEKLKVIGADAKSLDCTRILRVAGTVNTKANRRVQIIEINNNEYDIHDLKNDYLPEIPQRKNQVHKKGRPTKLTYLFNQYTLYYARLQDIVKLCELREWDLKGHREFILFIYRYWTCCHLNDVEDALRQVLELNGQFIEPLLGREAIRATKSAEKVYLSKDKQYNYKNETLIELLEITEEEQKGLKSIIGSKEKRYRNNEQHKEKRRNVDGLTKREQEKQDRIIKIKELISRGFNMNQVAIELQVNRSTISKYYGFLFK